MAIYGNSKHPVLIKKVTVNIWSLRDEIEYTLKKRLEYSKAHGIELKIDDLKQEYSPNTDPVSPLPDNKQGEVTAAENKPEVKKDEAAPAPFKEGADFEGSEEDMIAAMEAQMGPEEGEEDAQASEQEEDKPQEPMKEGADFEGSEEDMIAAMEASVEESEKEEGGEAADALADVMADAINEFAEGGGKVFVRQRHPHLPKELVSKGRTLLAEIYMDKILLFSNKKFIEGQSIVIEFDITKKFLLNGTVMFCKEHNLKSRIISETPFIYRMGISFTFLKKGERTLLRQFLSAVQPDITRPELETVQLEQKEESLDDVLDGLDL